MAQDHFFGSQGIVGEKDAGYLPCTIQAPRDVELIDERDDAGKRGSFSRDLCQ